MKGQRGMKPTLLRCARCCCSAQQPAPNQGQLLKRSQRKLTTEPQVSAAGQQPSHLALCCGLQTWPSEAPGAEVCGAFVCRVWPA